MSYRTVRVLLDAAGLLITCGLLCAGVSAQVPPLIRYQGTLVDANNVPLEGSYSLTFRVMEALPRKKRLRR
ncbi:MAG: hypothetical protein Q8R91_05480 [Candidatus Omnitrophota bacterium]|nr:hypothetical protein [Candidatus Omnitrophota bacterium]